VKNSTLHSKSYAFALKIIEVCRDLMSDKKEFVLSKQLLKAGTAIGALIREAEYAQSTADFISKLSIALKEANETEYWISLLKDSSLLNPTKAEKLESEIDELIRMLVASIKTLKNKKLNQNKE
jgi:four helix bundle protein